MSGAPVHLTLQYNLGKARSLDLADVVSSHKDAHLEVCNEHRGSGCVLQSHLCFWQVYSSLNSNSDATDVDVDFRLAH